VPILARIATAALTVVFVAGCARRETAVQSGNRAQVLYQNIVPEPADLDPHLVQTNPHFQIIMALGEGLVGYDPRDLHPVPGVAERWEISADGLTYTFHLRPNAQWSNGDAVTASDFVYSAQRILSPALGSTYRYCYDIVRGAKEYNAAPTLDFSRVGIRALDAHTLQIELAHPAPYLLFLLGHWSWYPVHQATLEKYGRGDQPYTGWTNVGHYVGNGPFTLDAWKSGQEIVVKKNPRYWGAGAVRLNEIHFRFIDNVDTEERAFRSGQLHLTEFVPVSKLAGYAAQTPTPLVIGPFFSTFFYAFDTTRPPFNDPRVRQAFSLAIDRERVAASQRGTGIRAAFSFVPPDTVGYTYDGPAKLRFDPAAARQLLAAAGYPDGRGFPAVDVTFSTSNRNQEITEVVQQMWLQNLGVRVNLVNQEGKVFHAERIARHLQFWRAGWVGDYIDPFAFLAVWLSNGGENQSGYASADYDHAAITASETLDPRKRFAGYQAAETILLRDLPLVPVFYDTRPHLISPSVHGWYPNLLDFHPYQAMSLQN
jgi:oligopeptide transport system substrate-binding protein